MTEDGELFPSHVYFKLWVQAIVMERGLTGDDADHDLAQLAIAYEEQMEALLNPVANELGC